MFTAALEVGLTVFPGVRLQIALAMPELQETLTL
jgi:hypothetical protein